jgi:SRSO17 transposase
MQARRKNMERMTEVVPGSDQQSLHHFLSVSPWDERAVINHVAREVDAVIGGRPESCLLIDETSFVKKGVKSVGVARQWCGRLGKVENCQVAVFAALAAGDRVSPVDVELYLPREWTDDPARCRAAGIPAGRMEFRTKPEMALAMVKRSRELGLRFEWVAADAVYGSDPTFMNGLDDMGITVVGEVRANASVLIERPDPECSRKPGDLYRVDQVVPCLSEERWEAVEVRESTRGTITLEMVAVEVWVWDSQAKQARPRLLVASREQASPGTVKYALTNADPATPKEELARLQRARFWIERTFQDAKSESGLADYQVRKWRGWQHHMALVMMAMLFMLKEREDNRDEVPLLSCSDIETLLARFLPRRDTNYEEIIRQMEQRHRARQASIDSARRKEERRAYAQRAAEAGLGNVT